MRSLLSGPGRPAPRRAPLPTALPARQPGGPLFLSFVLLLVAGLAAASPPDPRTMLLRCDVHDALRIEFRAHAREAGADFWGPAGPDSGGLLLRVRPDARQAIEALAGSPCELVSGNVYADAALAADAPLVQKDLAGNQTFFVQYPRYDQVVAYLRDLAANLPAGVVGSLSSIGKSVEGRDLYVFRVTSSGGPAGKKQIWINGLQHAREWVACTTALYILSNLIGSHATEPQMLEHFEWFVSPLANPDGYEYSHTTDRYWRKNRRPTPGPVDLNRNWPYFWSLDGGASTDPDSDVYRGPSALSEPETSSLHAAIIALPRRFALFDLHSFGQLILRNWGFTNPSVSSLEPALTALGNQMWYAAYLATGAVYTSIRAAQLYPASGCMDDWAGAAGMVAVTVELRDRGSRGFAVPPDAIVPTGEDGWAMAKAFVEFALSPEGAALGPQTSVPSDGVYITDGKPILAGYVPPVVATTQKIVRTTSRRRTTTKRRKTTTKRRKTTSRRRKTTTRRRAQ
ncbi:hypothetical protein DFJ74DRAFT_464638 [Hyaloraphidium curvatum]|nr:hypothetical protein DFJ74DRAFT_464638 [Hyaloraphidium curvatum]